MGLGQEQERLIVGALFRALKGRKELLSYCRLAIIESLVENLNTMTPEEVEYSLQELKYEQAKKRGSS